MLNYRPNDGSIHWLGGSTDLILPKAAQAPDNICFCAIRQTSFDIEGSSDVYNKCDHGLIIEE